MAVPAGVHATAHGYNEMRERKRQYGAGPTLPPDQPPPPPQAHATWLHRYRSAARSVQLAIRRSVVIIIVGVLVACIAAALALGATLRQPALQQARATPTATAASTPTLTPTLPAFLPPHPLAWHPVTLPHAASFPTVAFAGDGHTAYACFFTPDGQVHVWTTTDRATHWIPARSLPPQPSAGNRCELVVDQSDPSVAALCWVPNGAGAGDSCTVWLITTDGGFNWRYDPAAMNHFAAIDQLDSRAGVIYALRETASSGNVVLYHLWRSYDRMRSWQQADHSLPPAMAGFWLQPGGRGIFAVVSGGANIAPTQLVTSSDDGATWKQLTAPISLPAYEPARFASGPMSGAIVVLPHGAAPFTVCISNYTADAPTPNALTCSSDSGVSWRSRAPLFRASSTLVIGIAGDRAILAIGADYTLYRLANDTSQWQPLGSIPQFAVTYVPARGAGTLWAYIAPGISLDPQQRLFTASYG